jgi:cytochrome oxidase assembly protein ShyY1
VPLILFTPRWILLHVATAGVVVGFVALGWWQFGVYRDGAAQENLRELPPVSVTDLAAPGQPLGPAGGRAVVATGAYFDDASLVVPAREHEGVLGSYSVGVLQTADGALPVLRGWLAGQDDPAGDLPAGRVRVAGHLLPAETSADATDPGADLPTGQIGFIAPESVAAEVDVDEDELYDGYLLLTEETPRPAEAPVPLELSVVEPVGNVGPLQNLSYWALWWIFAGAAVVFWFSSARAAVRGQHRVSRGR